MTASVNLKKYHIIAGLPMTESALSYSCLSFPGDLITFDPNIGPVLHVPYKALKIALQREMYFELKYSLILDDSVTRRDFIDIANSLHIRDKMHNIIISSGAKEAFELRAPVDVVNLAYLFGLLTPDGKKSVDKTGRLLFMRASSRRIGKTFACVNCTSAWEDSDTSDEEDPVVLKALQDVKFTSNEEQGATSEETSSDDQVNTDGGNVEAPNDEPLNKKAKVI